MFKNLTAFFLTQWNEYQFLLHILVTEYIVILTYVLQKLCCMIYCRTYLFAFYTIATLQNQITRFTEGSTSLGPSLHIFVPCSLVMLNYGCSVYKSHFCNNTYQCGAKGLWSATDVTSLHVPNSINCSATLSSKDQYLLYCIKRNTQMKSRTEAKKALDRSLIYKQLLKTISGTVISQIT